MVPATGPLNIPDNPENRPAGTVAGKVPDLRVKA
jgi:hypothetical protein